MRTLIRILQPQVPMCLRVHVVALSKKAELQRTERSKPAVNLPKSYVVIWVIEMELGLSGGCL